MMFSTVADIHVLSALTAPKRNEFRVLNLEDPIWGKALKSGTLDDRWSLKQSLELQDGLAVAIYSKAYDEKYDRVDLLYHVGGRIDRCRALWGCDYRRALWSNNASYTLIDASVAEGLEVNLKLLSVGTRIHRRSEITISTNPRFEHFLYSLWSEYNKGSEVSTVSHHHERINAHDRVTQSYTDVKARVSGKGWNMVAGVAEQQVLNSERFVVLHQKEQVPEYNRFEKIAIGLAKKAKLPLYVYRLGESRPLVYN